MENRRISKPAGISFSVPAVPPSGNAYVRHTKMGRHYVTEEANRFKDLVFHIANSKKLTIRWKHYGVGISIFLGRKQKGDLDNFAKVMLDSLVYSAIIDSDAKVTELRMSKTRDIDNPRTVISVWAV
jgi:Holliday junction resolvase RusA-like endonuclease